MAAGLPVAIPVRESGRFGGRFFWFDGGTAHSNVWSCLAQPQWYEPLSKCDAFSEWSLVRAIVESHPSGACNSGSCRSGRIEQLRKGPVGSVRQETRSGCEAAESRERAERG